MKTETTAIRLRKLLSSKNMKQIDVLRRAQPFCEKYKIKLTKSDLSQYISGKVEPGQDKLTILGLALNVNEAWLMGYDVPMTKDSTSPQSLDSLDQELISSLERLTEDQKRLLLAQIRILEEHQ